MDFSMRGWMRVPGGYLILALCLFLVLFPACGKAVSDEAVLRQMVEDAARAAEAKDMEALMGRVSRDYHDENGNDYNAVKGILFFEFMKPGNINVIVRGVEVRVEGDAAVVDAKVFLVRGRDIEDVTDIIPEDAEGIKFSVVFRREGRTWKVIGAGWTGVGIAGLI